MALTRSDILSAPDLPTRIVPVPRWGGDVIVKGMPVSHTGYMNFITRPITYKDEEGRKLTREPDESERQIRRFVGAVILSAVDDQGRQLFTWSDADMLREKHWLSVLEVAQAAFEMAGALEATDDEIDDEGAPLSNVDLGKGSSEPTLG